MIDQAVDQEVVLEVQDLQTSFFTNQGVVRAVDGVSFSLRKGETLGLVGESGSGKTMTALSILRLVPKPGARIVGGKILLDGRDLLKLSDREMRKIRGRQVSMILQDPQTSLNPVFSIGNQLVEALGVATSKVGQAMRQLAVQSLRQVNIAAPERRMHDYPHQMSGGMKQRVVGAIAMAGEPQVVIADEPTTALDVTIQLQYLRLLKELQRQTGMSIIFITHDFGIVARMCDRVAVMYGGRIVEEGAVRDIFNQPAHPYTEALIASVPKLEERVGRLYSIEGEPPLPTELPPGCRFAPRCPYARLCCSERYPPSLVVGDGHTAACWRHDPSWTP